MSERLRKRIDALRVEYVKTFEEEVAGFQAEMSGGDKKSLARRAHRIGGTAGSYQLDAVCQAAQEVERLCDRQGDEVLACASLEQHAAGQEAFEQQVERLCEELRAAQLLVLQAST